MLSNNFGEGYTPHVGLILISGLLFGPYGAVGSVLANGICDLLRGYNLAFTFTTEIVSLGISCLAYKLWYGNYGKRQFITKPSLHNTFHLLLFIGIIMICATLYSQINKELFYILYPETIPISLEIGIRYFINFFNSAFVFGIIGIWLSKKIDFVHIPKISKRELNKKFYKAIAVLILVSVVIITLNDFYNGAYENPIAESAILTILLFIYITKPIKSVIKEVNYTPIPEQIMDIFLLATLIILILATVAACDEILIRSLNMLLRIDADDIILYIMLISDILLFIFFIPSIFVLKYIERKVIEPIYSFSRIESFIKKGDKIKAEELINIYSNHVDDNNEIGMMARSYTDLINNTNEYIENIEEIEGERHRIESELDIAKRIQESILPTQSIVNEDYGVYGKSKSAKEVGGDFYDYYEIDNESLAIIVGDASGKGVPAAILSTITHAIIKQIQKSEKDPSKVLYLVNNELCENNAENMFITLWLGIYNKKTKILTFSNAGHNAPLIDEGDGFKEMTMNKCIVLGIMDDFKFVKEEVRNFNRIIIYTDGITDAKNVDGEFYGEKRLINILNHITMTIY
ncbi:PP2C family protein-serine/threonine phosphatase [Methanobrevibacter sp.]|uniref:PP2C family protein-serine/threonine phosphatase n=1 Tax=Methanobrevibacter sp. TaxID=66852 RepID=UPI00389072F6